MPLPFFLAAAAATTLPPANPALGLWTNPERTLAVRTAPCGAGELCGAIVWAAPVAQADAREAGIDKLIGIELLQDYRPDGAGGWKGRVYVPDMGRRFSSRIHQTSPDQLTISGCLVGSLFCRSQTWRRIG